MAGNGYLIVMGSLPDGHPPQAGWAAVQAHAANSVQRPWNADPALERRRLDGVLRRARCRRRHCVKSSPRIGMAEPSKGAVLAGARA